MSTEGFADFLDRMGHKVRNVAGSYWFDANPRIYSTFPFDQPYICENIDISAVLRKDGFALRYVCRRGEGRDSYVLAIDGDDYGLGKLSSKSRNQTRRGLEQCRVEQVSFNDLSAKALVLNRDTMLRQGRALPRDFESYWLRYYREAAKAIGAEAWCAFSEGALAAYLIAFETDGCCNILVVRSAVEKLKVYPNNALLFSYADVALKRPGIRRVSIGLEPIQQDMDGLDHFKLGLGFEKKPCGQRVEVAPWLRPILSGHMLSGARAATRLLPRNERIDKLSGLLNWLAEQDGRSRIKKMTA